MPKAFSIVVPVVEQHDKFLSALISRLGKEAHLIEEIIICRSGLDESKRDQYTSWLTQITIDQREVIPIFLESSRKQRNAGSNRNIGAQRAKSDWIAFIDADDVYSQERLSILNNIIEKNSGANLILHSYTYQTELDEYPLIQVNQQTSFELILNEALYDENFGRTYSEENTNIKVPVSAGGRSRVHHGHVTVRRSVFNKIQYPTDGVAEDGKFCRRVLQELGGVIYLALPLSIYVVNESATNMSPLKKRIKELRALLLSHR
jgi:glycosyltransferase involved in cell wall biosynthesis